MRRLIEATCAVALSGLLILGGFALDLSLRAKAQEPTSPARSSGQPLRSSGQPPTVSQGAIWTTSSATNLVISSGNATVGTVTNANGYVTMTSECVGNICRAVPVVVSSRPAPKLVISCDENECHAHSQLSMDEARAMLHRVTQRSVMIELVVDQRCQVQRETIQPKPKEDLVAAVQ